MERFRNIVTTRVASTLILALLAGLTGCRTTVESMPPRTALEQLMLSYAIRDSVAEWELSTLADRRVYLDTRYVDSIDDKFVVGEVRDWVGRHDAILVNDEADAEVRLELRTAAVGMASRDALVGIPSFALPVPGATPIETPELAIFKESRRKGLAALAITAFDTQTHRRLFGHGPEIGQTYHMNAVLMFVPVVRTRYNIPAEVELRHPEPPPPQDRPERRRARPSRR
ncbi:DUF6655 family protein [Phycisphaerales bacterium AB-hyl4]|uniref:DUF6655 family protein n=1 Tax=Natronomicrosphaera hydrolytica TaxID=3242702 RepID=A0ABV4UCB9_9BACT